MSNWWPWIVMGLGVASLFCYRYWLLLKSSNPQLLSDEIISESVAAGPSVANQAPAAPASAPLQNRHSPAAKVNKESADLKNELDEQALSAPASKPQPHYTSEHVWMPIVISLIVLISALFVILSNNTYEDAQQKWAFGVVGTIIGYWFKK